MRFLEVTNINRIKVWAKMIGIGSMLYGVVSIILAFFTSSIYVIPAIISVFFGKLLYDIGQEAKVALQSEDESLGNVQSILRTYGRFLYVLGMVIIMTILCYITFFIYIL